MWMNKNAHIDIRQDFINEETKRDTDVHEVKLTKRFISWLFRHYYTECLTFNFYDMDSSWDEFSPVTWDKRISTCVWQDYFDNGCWCETQREVDRLAKLNINDFRKAGHFYRRFWIGRRMFDDGSEGIHLYLYGRDIHEFDLHIFFKKRKG